MNPPQRVQPFTVVPRDLAPRRGTLRAAGDRLPPGSLPVFRWGLMHLPRQGLSARGRTCGWDRLLSESSDVSEDVSLLP